MFINNNASTISCILPTTIGGLNLLAQITINNQLDKNYAQGKTKTAAAFISNCGTWNDRTGYIAELQKYINVDVYGSCGTLRCSRFGSEDCFGMVRLIIYCATV